MGPNLSPFTIWAIKVLTRTRIFLSFYISHHTDLRRRLKNLSFVVHLGSSICASLLSRLKVTLFSAMAIPFMETVVGKLL